MMHVSMRSFCLWEKLDYKTLVQATFRSRLLCFWISDNRYNEYFGFTQSEVQTLLSDTGCQAYAEKIREWYDAQNGSETSSGIGNAVEDIANSATAQAGEVDTTSGQITDMGNIFTEIVENIEDLGKNVGEM